MTGESGSYEGNGEGSAVATVVAETEPFFRDVMEVYVDLLCRGDREVSRMLFRSGVRFAAAVHGMQRTAAAAEAGESGAARARTAAREHLEGCLFALWTAEQRRAARTASGDREAGPARETGPLFERGFAMLAALRGEHARPTAVNPAAAARGPALQAPPR